MPERDSLHDWEVILLAAYAWTRQDMERLAGLLSAAYLAAKQRAARRALSTMGAASDWTPTREDVRQADAQGKKDASSIAHTFMDLLKGYLLAQGFASATEARVGIASWVQTVARWKVPQIVNVTAGTGNDAGTSETVNQALDGDLVDAESGVVIDATTYRFTVLPEESSKDICAEYAGNTYPLDEWDTVISFPAHPSCPHQKVVIYNV